MSMPVKFVRFRQRPKRLVTPRVLLVVAAACLAPSGLVLADGAAADPTADIALVSMTAGSHHAKVGDSVTFTAVARNNGPDAVPLFTTFTTSNGLEPTDQICDFGTSPDTPSCEYTLLASGQSATSMLTVQILPGASRHEVVTACVTSPDVFTDPNPGHDCASSTLRIIGRLS